MRRQLHLAHHKHTGKILPHHHTSYRGLFVMLLMVGVALFGIRSTAEASFMDLSAKISGPIPTIPAYITTPAAGVTTTNPHSIVEGTCEYMSPANTVIIYIDDQAAGSSACQPGGVYSVPVTLPAGTHSLIAKTVNYTDDYGPDSSSIQVTYTPSTATPATVGVNPTGTTDGTTETEGSCTAIEPLGVISTPSRLEYGRVNAAKWEFTIIGGCAPYTALVDWGDKSVDKMTVKDNEPVTVRHAYDPREPSFDVTLRVIDATDQKTSYTIAAVSTYDPTIYGGGLVEVEEPFILSQQGILIQVFVAYAGVLTLVGVMSLDTHIRRPHIRITRYK